MPDRPAFADRVLEIETLYGGDSAARRVEMEKLRDEFFHHEILQRLRKSARALDKTEDELYKLAAQILMKRGLRAARHDAHAERRAHDEERFLSSARVAWHKLLKSQGIAAARPRSKTAGLATLTGAAPKLRRLEKLRSCPKEAAALIEEYVARHALHLLDLCERAKGINEKFVSPELERSLSELHRVADAAAGGSETLEAPPRQL